MANSLEKTKELLKYQATMPFKYLSPFVVVDPGNLISIEDYMDYPALVIDLSETKAGGIPPFLEQVLTGKYPIVIFKNIDKIYSRKDKQDWISMIMMGLKGESGHFIIDYKNITSRYVPFSRVKVICTCSEYPDYLKKTGYRGWIGADFSKYV